MIAIVSMILMTGTVSGQEHANIGIKGGLNVYNIDMGNGSNYDSKLGLNLGLLGHIHLTGQFALQPELVFSGQGAKFSRGSDTNLNLNYLNVPVLLQYMFDNGFRLQAGPQVGFLLSANQKSDNSTTDIKGNYKSIDFGIGLGGSYVHVPTGFGVDLRYNLGLSNINENTALVSNNRGFQLGVFYLFGHK
jgi:hypothetical protein